MKQVFSLNEDWKLHKEVKQEGVEDADNFDMFSNYTKTGALLGEGSDGFCDDGWRVVQLPHDWLVEEPFTNVNCVQGYKPKGTAWYRKWFFVPKEWDGKRVFVRFDGISGQSVIVLNSITLAKSESSYTPLHLEIGDMLHYGEPNLLAVRTDNFRGEGWWYDGCGIYRDVWLTVAEESCFENDGVFLSAKKQEGAVWNLSVRAEISRPEEGQSLRVRCLGQERVVPVKAVTSLQMEINDPPLWSLEVPHTVAVKTELLSAEGEVLDVYEEENFGFRTVEFDAVRGCVVNGEPVKLKGFCMHHDHAGVGVAMPYELQRYRLQQLRNMGCNAIRTSHNPQSPGFYKACDELGIAVMDETRHFGSAAEELHQLSTMVRRDRNHPCVFFWSLFNEEPLQCSTMGEHIARTMKRTVDALDGTRLISGGMNGPLECEGAVKVVDMMGFNYLQYGYDEFHEIFPDMPIVGSETSSHLTQRREDKTFATDTLYRRSAFGQYRGRVRGEVSNLHSWSDTPGDTWERIAKRPFVAGGFGWTGMDYRGEARWPGVIADFGSMDLCAFPKDNYYWYQAMWRENILHLERYEDPEHPGEEILMCYSDGDELLVEQEGCPDRRYPNDPYHPVPYSIAKDLPVRVTAYRGGVEFAHKTNKKPVAPSRLLLIAGGKSALSRQATVFNAYLVDGEGILCEANDRVKFTAEGGLVLGVGNGDASSHAPENTDACLLYHGCCQVVVRSGEGEALTVKAVCGDFTAEQTVEIRPAACESIPSCEAWLRICPWRMSDVFDTYPLPEQIHDAMFNWIPTMVGVPKSLMMSGKQGFATIYGEFTAPQGAATVHFEGVSGWFDLYLAGKKILCAESREKKDYVFPVPEECFGKRVPVSLVFRCDGGEITVGNAYLTT